MKKLLIILSIIIVVILGALIVTPIIFKDEIKGAVDDVISENLNAQVYYDPSGFSISLIQNFPNFTLTIADFGIVGRAPFDTDTLVSINSFGFEIDLMSVINGEQIQINAITLDQPNITVLVLEDGQANYDIAVSSDTVEVVAEEEVGESAAFAIAIKKWEILNANITYVDQSAQMVSTLFGLTHTGQGDFTEDIFDLTTTTHIDGLSFSMEEVNYLNNKTFDAKLDLNMDLPNAVYTFKENTMSLNAFNFGFDGFVAMPGDDIEMDLTYSGQDMSLKSLLSMIPGVYQDYLAGVEAQGKIGFEGYAKGIYNDTLLPDVNAKLSVDNGSFKYAEYPFPIEKINIKTELNVPGDNMDAMTFNMSTFSMLMDGEAFDANLFFGNLQNYTWKFGMKGAIDLEKLLKIVPMEGMELKGLIAMDMNTSGNMKLVDEERYDEIPAEGTLEISDFYYADADLPQGFGINSSKMSFSPMNISLEKFDATLGNSDMQMTGNLSNFIGYALSETEVLKGALTFNSNSFDVNEWMTEEDVVAVDTTVAVEEEMEIVRVPTNIDFRLDSKINKLLYEDYDITDLDGIIVVKDGIATLENVDFNMLGGEFVMNGAYNSVPEQPDFDFQFLIKDLSIPKSYETFNSVQTIAPAAKNMTGLFSTDFKVQGIMGNDMMPIYDVMTGSGIIGLKDAAFNGEDIMKQLASVASVKKSELTMKDLKIKAEIKNGRLFVEPFEIDYNDQKVTIFGSNGMDGSLDYFLDTPVDTGEAGKAVNSLLSDYIGDNQVVGETMILKLNLTGSYEKPKIKILGTENTAGQSPKEAVKDLAKKEFDKQKKIAEEKARAELAKQKKIAERKAKEELAKQQKIAEEKLKKEAEAQAKSAADKAKKDAANKLKKLF
ncbi:MAG: AsmA family protein [Reichenbachiella sp.]